MLCCGDSLLFVVNMFNVVKPFHFENESKQMQSISGSKTLNKLKCHKLSF